MLIIGITHTLRCTQSNCTIVQCYQGAPSHRPAHVVCVDHNRGDSDSGTRNKLVGKANMAISRQVVEMSISAFVFCLHAEGRGRKSTARHHLHTRLTRNKLRPSKLLQRTGIIARYTDLHTEQWGGQSCLLRALGPEEDELTLASSASSFQAGCLCAFRSYYIWIVILRLACHFPRILRCFVLRGNRTIASSCRAGFFVPDVLLRMTVGLGWLFFCMMRLYATAVARVHINLE
jgi:hypothetical protein